MERLPCFATDTPAPATTKALTVEMLNVCAPSPPVPQVSTSDDLGVLHGIARAAERMARANPTISSVVSPLITNAVSNDPINTGEDSPARISPITAAASVSVRSSRRTTLCSASRTPTLTFALLRIDLL